MKKQKMFLSFSLCICVKTVFVHAKNTVLYFSLMHHPLPLPLILVKDIDLSFNEKMNYFF